MGIITGYPDDTTVTDSDKYLTSDSSGATKLTSALGLKNYVIPAASITVDKFAVANIYTTTYQATSTGSKSITGVGFKPRKVTTYAISVTSSAMESSTGGAFNTTAGIKQFVKASASYTSGSTTEENAKYDATIFMGDLNSPTGNGFRTSAQFTSFDSDGITFNVTARTAGYDTFYLIFE